MNVNTFSTRFLTAWLVLAGLLFTQCDPEEIDPGGDDSGGDLGGGLGGGGETPKTAAELADEFVRDDANTLVYYPFSGNADNAMAAEYHGTVTGATLSADRFNNAEAAYAFDGSSTIDFGANPIPAGSVSFSFWINVSSTDIVDGQSYRFLSNREVCNRGDFIDFAFSSSETNNFRVGMEVRGDGQDLGSTPSVGANDLPMNEWVHVAGVIDQSQGTSTMYFNGVEQASTTWDNTKVRPTNPDGHLGIATSPCVGSVNGVQAFVGMLDDISVFDRVLTADEVAVLAEIE